MKRLLSVVFVSVFFIGSTFAAPTTNERFNRELDGIANSFEAQYAPADWKSKFSGWKLDNVISEAKNKAVTSSGTMQSYRKILDQFFKSTKDYHVSVQFHATEASQLPFTVKGVGGKYFIVYVDRKKLPESSFPYHIGDELVEFGNQTTDQAVLAIASLSQNTKETDLALATMNLTSRKAARGLPVLRGPIELKIKKKGESTVHTQQLIWDYTPEKILSPNMLSAVASSSLGFPNDAPKAQKNRFQRMMIGGDESLISRKGDSNPYLLGNKRSFLPSLGKKVWESQADSIFESYIFQSDERKLIGFIRIPSYVPSDYEKAIKEFSETVNKFEEITDGLVIDQHNNPGGSVFYLYALASTLSTQTLQAPKHRMTITQADVAEALTMLEEGKDVVDDATAKEKIGKTVSGYPVDYSFALFLKEFCNFTIEQWNQGKRFSDPYYLWGVDHINPYPGIKQYSKPIVLLVNELDFSGGDFFPAILQDNKRVTVLGTRTSGAGGYVLETTQPNLFGILKYRITGSIAERVDLNPIENLGVKPDVNYTLTENDLQNNYEDYLKKIKSVLKDLIK